MFFRDLLESSAYDIKTKLYSLDEDVDAIASAILDRLSKIDKNEEVTADDLKWFNKVNIKSKTNPPSFARCFDIKDGVAYENGAKYHIDSQSLVQVATSYIRGSNIEAFANKSISIPRAEVNTFAMLALGIWCDENGAFSEQKPSYGIDVFVKHCQDIASAHPSEFNDLYGVEYNEDLYDGILRTMYKKATKYYDKLTPAASQKYASALRLVLRAKKMFTNPNVDSDQAALANQAINTISVTLRKYATQHADAILDGIAKGGHIKHTVKVMTNFHKVQGSDTVSDTGNTIITIPNGDRTERIELRLGDRDIYKGLSDDGINAKSDINLEYFNRSDIQDIITSSIAVYVSFEIPGIDDNGKDVKYKFAFAVFIPTDKRLKEILGDKIRIDDPSDNTTKWCLIAAPGLGLYDVPEDGKIELDGEDYTLYGEQRTKLSNLIGAMYECWSDKNLDLIFAPQNSRYPYSTRRIKESDDIDDLEYSPRHNSVLRRINCSQDIDEAENFQTLKTAIKNNGRQSNSDYRDDVEDSLDLENINDIKSKLVGKKYIVVDDDEVKNTIYTAQDLTSAVNILKGFGMKVTLPSVIFILTFKNAGFNRTDIAALKKNLGRLL